MSRQAVYRPRVGDTVKWVSKSFSNSRERTGVVVAVGRRDAPEANARALDAVYATAAGYAAPDQAGRSRPMLDKGRPLIQCEDPDGVAWFTPAASRLTLVREGAAR